MSNLDTIVIEACVNSVTSAIEAEHGGAERVELCDNLYDGGTTPSAGSIEAARSHLSIDLNVIIRPRGADFLYNEVEFETMKTDILRAKEFGADGVVFGMLNSDGTINREQTRTLVDLAGDMSTTFHRAFDMTADPFAALEDLADLGVDRVLTSGQRPSAIAGVELLTELVQAAEERIIVMPGVGISASNIGDLIRATRAREYHVLCEKPVLSKMKYLNKQVYMGFTPDPSEYETPVTDRVGIRAICDAAAPMPPLAEL